MKILLTVMSLLFVTLSLLAEQIDIAKAKGTQQEIIASLIPQPGDREVDANITLKAVFTRPIKDSGYILSKSVVLEKLNEESETKGFLGFRFGQKSPEKTVEGEVDYDRDTDTLLFRPNKPLETGYYEVRYQHLRQKGAGRKGRIAPISYRFYVPEIINGYTLPPEPDPKINNATLLGVDSNNNGIRDDVERFIIKKYKDHHKAVTEIGFQAARAYQKILDNPLDWEENHKALHNALDCNFYFESYADEFGDPVIVDHSVVLGNLKNLQLNTKSRVKAYLLYDRQLSGGVYRLTPITQQKSRCSQEVLELVGGAK